ncbi:MAG TPA: phosphoglycerate kinase [Anaerolineales bacterium]
MRSVRDLEVRGRRVLLRVDFNVPLSEGTVQDDTRIRAALPTIRLLHERGASVILCSHLGRPKGKLVPSLSLRPVAARLAELLDEAVEFAADCVGPAAQAAAARLRPGGLLMLENTRFYPQETENDPTFAGQLAELAELYVNDAFGSAHRAHASTEGVAHFLPSAAGLLVEQEVKFIKEALSSPERPYVVLLGGAKISDKIGLVRKLLSEADALLVGGGMANTFLAAQGLDLADSLVEQESLPVAAELLAQPGSRIHLPVDVVVASEFSELAEHRVAKVDQIPVGWRAADIGPQTLEQFSEVLRPAKTILWNGPMGVFEIEIFSAGTRGIAQAIAGVHALSIVGGGDSVAAVQQAGLAARFTHLSTGGGATLALLEGQTLPGLAVLQV